MVKTCMCGAVSCVCGAVSCVLRCCKKLIEITLFLSTCSLFLSTRSFDTDSLQLRHRLTHYPMLSDFDVEISVDECRHGV